MSWRPGRIFTAKGTRGRWWYWKGQKKGKKWMSLAAGKPTGRPRHAKRRRR